MKKWWLILFIVCFSQTGWAQNDFFFGHYLFNPSYFNPAWSGTEDQAFVAFQHRSQWVGYSSSFDGSGGAPSTQLLTTVVPIRNFFISSVGLNVSNDNLGPVNNVQLQVPLTYTLDLGVGRLSIGASPGILSQTLKSDQYRPNDPNDPILIGLDGDETQVKMNLGAGIFFQSNKNLFIGLSATNLLQPGFDFGLDSLLNEQEIAYMAYGGYSLKINNDIKVSPTILIRSNLSTFTFDIGGILTLRDKLWTGLSYRRGESAIIYLGYSIFEDNRLKVGYSFDYVFQEQEAKAPTSHEIFLRYDLPDLVFGGRKAVKTPRFTF